MDNREHIEHKKKKFDCTPLSSAILIISSACSCKLIFFAIFSPNLQALQEVH